MNNYQWDKKKMTKIEALVRLKKELAHIEEPDFNNLRTVKIIGYKIVESAKPKLEAYKKIINRKNGI